MNTPHASSTMCIAPNGSPHASRRMTFSSDRISPGASSHSTRMICEHSPPIERAATSMTTGNRGRDADLRVDRAVLQAERRHGIA